MKSMCNDWNFVAPRYELVQDWYDRRSFPFRTLYWDIGLIKKEKNIKIK